MKQSKAKFLSLYLRLKLGKTSIYNLNEISLPFVWLIGAISSISYIFYLTIWDYFKALSFPANKIPVVVGRISPLSSFSKFKASLKSSLLF